MQNSDMHDKEAFDFSFAHAAESHWRMSSHLRTAPTFRLEYRRPFDDFI